MYDFIKIGFLEIQALDILDVLLVGLLIFQLYKLLRGSLAFNIFIGMLLVYMVSLAVKALGMKLLSGILGQFIDVGVIALLIVFQPEVRRFLLFIGRGNIFKKGGVWKAFIKRGLNVETSTEEAIDEILIALNNLAAIKTGAILVFTKTSQLRSYANTGVVIDGKITSKLLESIFDKKAPLHDGAVIIAENKIIAAGCVLPVSDNPSLPARIGMRHRAAVGMSEVSDAFVVVVSEEKGYLGYAKEGELKVKVASSTLKNELKLFLTHGI